jgi:hypothetical protein
MLNQAARQSPFVLYSLPWFLFVLSGPFFVTKGADVQTLKMQNKPKSKTAQIYASPLMLSNYKNALLPPQPKNKPKQTQIKDTPAPASKVAQASSLSATQAFCHSERSRGIYLNSHPDVSGFLIFAICALIFDMFFMTNEPNFQTSENTVSPYWIAGCWKPKADSSEKNEPKRTQLGPSHPSAPP